MSEHLTDEEQSERIKKWWSENYKSLLLSLAIVGSGYYGYNSYMANQEQMAQRGSQLFNQMAQQSQNQEWDKVKQTAEALIEQDGVEAYTNAARLSLAKVAVEKQDYPQAIKELETLIANGKEDALGEIAKIRLARVYLQTKEYDKGLKLFNTAKNSAFSPQILEIRGDLFQQKGDKKAAINAYEQAITQAQAFNIPVQGLDRKLDYLKTAE